MVGSDKNGSRLVQKGMQFTCEICESKRQQMSSRDDNCRRSSSNRIRSSSSCHYRTTRTAQPSSARATNKNQLQLYLRLVNHVRPLELRVLTAFAEAVVVVDVAAAAAIAAAVRIAGAVCTLLLVFRLVAIVIGMGVCLFASVFENPEWLQATSQQNLSAKGCQQSKIRSTGNCSG